MHLAYKSAHAESDHTDFFTEPTENCGEYTAPQAIRIELDKAICIVDGEAANKLSVDSGHTLLEQQLLQEKTEALEQLHTAEAKYKTLMEQMPVITYIASLETPVKLLYVSPQISQLGFPVADWLDDPQGLLKRVHPDDLAETIEAYAHTYEHHVPLRCEYRLNKHDGHSRWFRDKANVVFNEAGESLFLQGVLVDITKDKETEQELSYYRRRLEELVYQRTEQLEKQCMILKSANANLDAALMELKQTNARTYCGALP